MTPNGMPTFVPIKSRKRRIKLKRDPDFITPPMIRPGEIAARLPGRDPTPVVSAHGGVAGAEGGFAPRKPLTFVREVKEGFAGAKALRQRSKERREKLEGAVSEFQEARAEREKSKHETRLAREQQRAELEEVRLKRLEAAAAARERVAVAKAKVRELRAAAFKESIPGRFLGSVIKRIEEGPRETPEQQDRMLVGSGQQRRMVRLSRERDEPPGLFEVPLEESVEDELGDDFGSEFGTQGLDTLLFGERGTGQRPKRQREESEGGLF